MQWISWMGLALGTVMVTAVTTKVQPPPVILDLGPVKPTPVPTTNPAEKKRLVTTITVQNTVEGETVVSFEVSDMADEGDGKFHLIAAKHYSLAETKPELKDLRGKLLEQIRHLERDMLDYAVIAGPPKPRPPIGSPELGGGGGQP